MTAKPLKLHFNKVWGPWQRWGHWGQDKTIVRVNNSKRLNLTDALALGIVPNVPRLPNSYCQSRAQTRTFNDATEDNHVSNKGPPPRPCCRSKQHKHPPCVLPWMPPRAAGHHTSFATLKQATNNPPSPKAMACVPAQEPRWGLGPIQPSIHFHSCAPKTKARTLNCASGVVSPCFVQHLEGPRLEGPTLRGPTQRSRAVPKHTNPPHCAATVCPVKPRCQGRDHHMLFPLAHPPCSSGKRALTHTWGLP